MAVATQIPAVQSPTEMLRNVSPTERLKLLGELVRLCLADGNLNKPLQVTDEKQTHVGFIAAVLPRTTVPYPELTPEEEIEIQRRIGNRHNAISHEEFVKRVRQRFHDERENGQS